jgi:alpha-galactosidase
MRSDSYILIATLAAGVDAIVSADGTGRLPALGWNSWNEYACNINEAVFLKVGELMVSKGLRDVGYQYVNIDDCWSNRRDGSGRINPDAKKFPNGIKGLADKIHALGLKIGIYSDAGTLTCGLYEGSLYHEDVDAATFADWGIDYLKYDNCQYPSDWNDEYNYAPDKPQETRPAPPGYDYSTSKSAQRYYRMRDALLKQKRTIQYGLCNWGNAHVERWGNKTGHSWRMFGDIYPIWKGKNGLYNWGILPILNQAAHHWNDTGFWGHSDWDMLEVGNGALTYEESRTHFALWAALKSPLIIGTKLDGISDQILAVLKNKELIAYNQDPVYSDGIMPFGLTAPLEPTTGDSQNPPSQWVGTSTKGIHVYLLNLQDQQRKMTITFSQVPGLRSSGTNKFIVHDMWTGKDIGQFEGSFGIDVKRHDTAALRFTTVNGAHPNGGWKPTDE